MDYRVYLGIAATVIAFIGYVPYFKHMFEGKTKPHAFTWFLWGLLMAIAFAAQVADGAGAGAYVTGASAIICFAIAAFAVFKGERTFPKWEWIIFAGTIVAIGLWIVTDNPLWSVILVSVIDAVAFGFTFRKAYKKPHEETIFAFCCSLISYPLAIAALTNYSLTTWLYLASLIVTNAAFVAMVLWRRSK